MMLCIDSGNTRLKWGLADSRGWRAQGVLSQTEIAILPEIAGNPVPQRILIANVAGAEIAARIESALAPLGVAAEFVRSTAQAGGVSNGYANPSQLGVDRWCALIGAWNLVRQPCIVAGSGTALTIDTLDQQGHFQGGVILPGLDLMRQALARNTAQLPLASGQWQAWPDNTDDAIASGCLEAQLGAIERAQARSSEATCLLFGGNAAQLAGRLNCPHRVVDNLVLEGLRVLASNDG